MQSKQNKNSNKNKNKMVKKNSVPSIPYRVHWLLKTFCIFNACRRFWYARLLQHRNKKKRLKVKFINFLNESDKERKTSDDTHKIQKESEIVYCGVCVYFVIYLFFCAMNNICDHLWSYLTIIYCHDQWLSSFKIYSFGLKGNHQFSIT